MPDDRKLQTTINALTLLAVIIIVGCNIEECSPCKGTLETKNEPYKGKPGVTQPHADDPPEISAGPADCDSYTKHCGYFPLVRVGVHNPTTEEVAAHVRCSFFVGDWDSGQRNERGDVRIKPHSTKYVELQFNISVQGDQASQFGANCETKFNKP